MKHILPILTLALLGAAATASASNFYYDYYLAHSSTDVTDHYTPDGVHQNQNDTFTYGTITSFEKDANGKVAVSMENTFTAHRESNWSTALADGDPNNFFRIELGEENNQKVRLYLTDFVTSLYSDDQTYHSDSNALFREAYNEDTLIKRAIVEYGYRTLTLNEETGKYEPGATQKFSTVIADENGTIEIDGNMYRLNEANVTKIDEIPVLSSNPPAARYQYDLGTFDPGDIVEVYMKDSVGNEVYSFSSYVNGVYTPFDNNAPSVDAEGNYLDAEGHYLDATQGGFSDGGYVVGSTGTDGLLDRYYFVEPTSKPYGDYRLYTEFDSKRWVAPEKAMPLSQLIPTNGLGVAFGIYAYATGEAVVGKPLPGGLQISLIAGLFGLGFCYIRRRKAIVG